MNPSTRSRPVHLVIAGVILALLTAGVTVVADRGATRPQALSERAGARYQAGGHPQGQWSPALSTATVGEVLLEPDLLHALVTGHEPVGPRDTVGSAIVAGRLLFVGASYSVGLGATGKAFSFPSLLDARLDHVPFRVDAVSGTGFQNPGVHDQGTFAERLLRDPTTPPPRIVLIQGGRDDYRYPLTHEYQAALSTIQLAQRRFEEAQVVVVGPVAAHLPVPPRLLVLRDEIKKAAVTARAGFIDPLAEDWITVANEHLYAGRIPGHPNDAGYAYITSRLHQELPAALAASQPPLEPDGS